MKEIAVYTVMIGNYDSYNSIESKYLENDLIDYYYFTDNINKKIDGYKMIYIEIIKNDLKMTQRYYKIVMAKILQKYKYSIYYDGNVKVTNKLSSLIYNLSSYDIMVYNYIIPINVYTQFLMPYIGIYYKKEPFIKLYKTYIDDGWKDNMINSTNKFIIKRHNLKMNKFLEFWYNETLKIGRDEFTLLYSVYKNNIRIKIDNGFNCIKYFKVYWHRNEDVKKEKGYNSIISPNFLNFLKDKVITNKYIDLILCFITSLIFNFINLIYRIIVR